MEAMIDRDALTPYVDRVLVLHEERKSLNADIAIVYEEAKSAGFVTSIIRQIVRERQMDADEREAHYNLLDSYRHALGMLADTPLGQAALDTATVERPLHRGRGRPKKARDDDALKRAFAAEPAGAA